MVFQVFASAADVPRRERKERVKRYGHLNLAGDAKNREEEERETRETALTARAEYEGGQPVEERVGHQLGEEEAQRELDHALK